MNRLHGWIPLLLALLGFSAGWGAAGARAQELRRDVDNVTKEVAELRGVVSTVAALSAQLGAIEYRLSRIEQRLDRVVR